MNDGLDSGVSYNNSSESPITNEINENSNDKKEQPFDNENSDDGCVDSEDGEGNTSVLGEVGVNDDRSQTPLQDEVESNHSSKFESIPNEFDTNEPDKQESADSSNEQIENKTSNEVDDINENEEKVQEVNSKVAFKESELNDDHGELDYEEEVDDNRVSNKNIDNCSDDNSDNGEVDSNSNQNEKEHKREKEFNFSDGELLDEEDCEEGEIKEASSRRHYQRPLCRFFTRGSCTWGINCRFLHPGINDKGNYSMLHHPVYNQAPTMPPPIRVPHYSNVHERLGSRAAPSQHVDEGVHKGPVGGHESAWERGQRHAKEIRNKSKVSEVDDKKDTSPVSSPSPSPTNASRASQLAPPPPRDPFYDDLHRPHPPMSSSMPPMHPMHMGPPLPTHPMDSWSYRAPNHSEFEGHRWPRPSHHHNMQSHDFVHQNFSHHYDYRMQGRDTRFNSSQRGSSRMERFSRPGEAGNRGRSDDWKDPWSRNKASKSKKKSSSGSGSGKRSRASYSSFTSSSYSSRSRSASSYSSSRSSSRSSSSRSRSRDKSPTHKNTAPPSTHPRNHSEAAKCKSNVKVIPPSLADLSASPSHNLTPTKHKVPVNLPLATSSKPPPPKPAAVVAPPLPPPPTAPVPVISPVVKELPPPVVPKAPMQITLPAKAVKSLSKTSQLHKSVAEAFKDPDEEEEERASKKPRLSRFSPEDSRPKAPLGASTLDTNLDSMQANVSYPLKVSQEPLKNTPSDLKRKKLPDKFARSRDSSDSRSSYSSSSSGSSGSSSSSHSRHPKRYSHFASPISSDSSASPSKQKSKQERLSLSKFPPQDFPGYSRPPNVAGFPHDRNGMRGGHLRSGRGGDHASERREYRGEERSFEEAQRHPPPRRPDYHRHPPDFRGNPLYAGESGGRDRSDRGRKPMDASRFDRPDFARESRDYRSKEEEGKGDLFRYGEGRHARGMREVFYGGRGRSQRGGGEYDERPRRESPSLEGRRGMPAKEAPPSRYPNNLSRKPKEATSFRKRLMSPGNDGPLLKGVDDSARPGRASSYKAAPRHDRREELLMQLKAVEDAIAKKKNKNA